MQTTQTSPKSSVPPTAVRPSRRILAVERLENIESRIPVRLLIIVGAVLLVIIVFFCARSEGVKQGQREAREKIEAENDLLAGPNSLLQ